MLTKRVTAPRWLVSIMDPALGAIDRERVALYVNSRDIDDLGDLSKLPEQPTGFHCLPLSVKLENHRLALVEERDANSAWIIFAFSVDRFRHFPDAPSPVTEKGSEITHLPDESREMIDPETIIEIARAICEMPSRGDTNPFSPPDGWERARIRQTAYRALRPTDAPSDSPDTKPAAGETSDS